MHKISETSAQHYRRNKAQYDDDIQYAHAVGTADYNKSGQESVPLNTSTSPPSPSSLDPSLEHQQWLEHMLRHVDGLDEPPGLPGLVYDLLARVFEDGLATAGNDALRIRLVCNRTNVERE